MLGTRNYIIIVILLTSPLDSGHACLTFDTVSTQDILLTTGLHICGGKVGCLSACLFVDVVKTWPGMTCSQFKPLRPSLLPPCCMKPYCIAQELYHCCTLFSGVEAAARCNQCCQGERGQTSVGPSQSQSPTQVQEQTSRA